MEKTPSAFSISHYILLFLVSTICTISVVWVLIAANNREAALHDKQLVQQKNMQKTCQRDVADKIVQLWENNADQIPPQYIVLINSYADRVVSVRTTGICNGKPFVCPMGAKRVDCDPCAMNSAQKRAMFQHISDAIDSVCKGK